MLRKSGELVALVSAILCVLVVAGWIRSRQHSDVILIQTPGGRQYARVCSAFQIIGGVQQSTE
jgi:hypothetical protein